MWLVSVVPATYQFVVLMLNYVFDCIGALPRPQLPVCHCRICASYAYVFVKPRVWYDMYTPGSYLACKMVVKIRFEP